MYNVLVLSFLCYFVQGPRVLIVGPRDSGKSTLSRILVSWAVKEGKKPYFVDLDTREGSISFPCFVAATQVIDPVKGIPCGKPLVYFHGHRFPRDNMDYYKVILKTLAQTLEAESSACDESHDAGMVINGLDCSNKDDTELLLHAIDLLKINIILIIDQDKYLNLLKEAVRQKPNVEVINLPKSRSVVERSALERQTKEKGRMEEYFYRRRFHIVGSNFFHIYRIGGPPSAPPVAVNISPELLNSVLAVSLAKEPSQITTSESIMFQTRNLMSVRDKYLIVGKLNGDDARVIA